MLALCTGKCLFPHMGTENNQTMFFHVTAGNVKFVLCSETMTMTNFCSSTQFFLRNTTHRANVILEILYSRLKNFYERQQNMGR